MNVVTVLEYKGVSHRPSDKMDFHMTWLEYVTLKTDAEKAERYEQRIRELEAGATDALTALRGAGTGMSGDRILSGVEAMLMAEAALNKALAPEPEKETP